MKMFFMSAFGLIKSTDKIEKEHELLLAAYNEYCQVEKSDELKQYTELESFVQSDAFAAKKKEIENLKFKGSPEEAQLKEFEMLSKNKQLKKFYSTLQSAELQRYFKIGNSETLAEYTALKKFMEDGSFAAEKKKSDADIFKGSEEERLLNEFKSLEKSKAIKTYFKLKNSPELKQSEEFSGSETLKKFEKLKAKVESNTYLDEKKEFEKLKHDTKIKEYLRFTSSKKYKIYTETLGDQLLHQYFELKEIAAKETENGKTRTPEEEKEFKKSETYSHLKKYNRLKKNKKLIIHFEISESPELKEFLEFESSDKLKSFHLLEGKIKSGNYINELADFKKLKLQAEIKKYFRFIQSSEFKIYSETKDRKILARYEELKQTTESGEFLNRKAYLEDRKKFEKTEAFAKSEKYKKLKASDDIIFLLKFEKSSEWKNYLQMENSKEKSRFEELQKLTESDEFLKRKAYLEDAKKWEKTDEYKKLQQYEGLKKKPHIERYFKYKSNNELDFFKQWKIVFSDDFSTPKLNTEKWQTVSYRAAQSMERNYSQPGDLQAFTSGTNIKTDGKTLKIETRKEKTSGLVWQLPFGFVEKEFDYSSGCINSSKSFWGKEGIWEAKVRYAPEKGLASVLYLSGEDTGQQINIIETGVENRVGLLKRDNRQTASVSGLKNGQFYIFRVEWGKDKITWKVNSKELLSIPTVPNLEMHINAASVVVNEISGALPASLEIDWIKVYQQKK